MSALPTNRRISAYRSVSIHGAIAEADPHALVLMLMSAAIDRMTVARGCLERGEIVRKAKLLHHCVHLIAELRGSLDLEKGGDLARNLDDLYEYMTRRLLLANAANDIRALAEVIGLLDEIRGAWAAIGPQVRGAAAPTQAELPSASAA